MVIGIQIWNIFDIQIVIIICSYNEKTQNYTLLALQSLRSYSWKVGGLIPCDFGIRHSAEV